MRKYFYFIPVAIFSISAAYAQTTLQGAWEGEDRVLVFSGNYFSHTRYEADTFISTRGGTWHQEEDELVLTYEYHTEDPDQVGEQEKILLKQAENYLILSKQAFKKIDDGSPGKLNGAWLITGRMRNGELRQRTPGPRKTMKILSGTRFQWIAYHTDTGEFFGTGGGTYTTKNGKYTENIDFFSRDQSRVGAQLEFDYEIKDGKWHHSGKSSRGKPIYEVWTLRSNIP